MQKLMIYASKEHQSLQMLSPESQYGLMLTTDRGSYMRILTAYLPCKAPTTLSFQAHHYLDTLYLQASLTWLLNWKVPPSDFLAHYSCGFL